MTAHVGGPIVLNKYVTEQHGGTATQGGAIEKALNEEADERLATYVCLIKSML